MGIVFFLPHNLPHRTGIRQYVSCEYIQWILSWLHSIFLRPRQQYVTFYNQHLIIKRVKVVTYNRTGRESIINESNHDLESFFCDSWFGFESFLKSINDLWFVIRFIFLLVVNESNTFQITRFIRFGAISSVPEPVYSFQNEVTPLWSRFVRFGFDLKLIRILFILIDLES